MIAAPWLGSALAGLASVVAAGSVAALPVAGASRRLPIAARTEIVPPKTGSRWFASERARRRSAGLVGLVMGLLLPFPGVVLAPVFALAGSRLPALLAHREVRRRRTRMDRQIPQLLDLLASASSAGLSGQLALRRAVDALGGPLGSELAATLDAIALGARWRDELALVADRLQLPDLRRAAAALSRTETLGSSLADSTAELAATVRAARRAAVMERARTAPVKMLFPLVFLVLPAFLLLTVVPVLLTTLQSIR